MICDFGVSALLATSSSKRNTFIGTLNWMAPEVVQAVPNYDTKADIWSLGVILLNMLTCRSPWRKAIASDTVFRRFVRDASYLREILPLSHTAVELFRRVLAWDPRARPSLSQFRRAVQRIDTFWMDEDYSCIRRIMSLVATYHDDNDGAMSEGEE